MRLFIAANFSKTEKQALIAERDRLLKSAPSALRTGDKNIHMTLAFLGEIPASALSRITSCIDAACAGRPELGLLFDRVGLFGDVLWLGAQNQKALFDLQRHLADELTAAGIPFDRKPFKPHVTLARRFNAKDRPSLQHSIPARVRAVSLMHSHRESGLLVYDELYLKALEGESSWKI